MGGNLHVTTNLWVEKAFLVRCSLEGRKLDISMPSMAFKTLAPQLAADQFNCSQKLQF